MLASSNPIARFTAIVVVIGLAAVLGLFAGYGLRAGDADTALTPGAPAAPAAADGTPTYADPYRHIIDAAGASQHQASSRVPTAPTPR